MTLSVLSPLQPTDPRQVVPFATLAADHPGTRLWTGQSLHLDAYQVFGHLAGAGIRVPVGISVGLMPLRHPLEAALAARSLAGLTGRPVVAGFGAATPRFVSATRGKPYDRPAQAAADYARSVRDALAGERVDHEGESHVMRGGLPPMPTPTVEVGLGVLRPAMARAAAGSADVVITWMTPPDYVREHLCPALAAGTPDGVEPPRIVTVVPVVPTAPGRDPVRLAEQGAAGHLQGAHYRDMLARAGVHYPEGDTAAGARAAVEAGVVATGSSEEILRQLDRYRAAGVDEVVLNPAPLLYAGDTSTVRDELGDLLGSDRDRRGDTALERAS